jgi:hypothetical protein
MKPASSAVEIFFRILVNLVLISGYLGMCYFIYAMNPGWKYLVLIVAIFPFLLIVVGISIHLIRRAKSQRKLQSLS